MKSITENHIEQYAIEELEGLGYQYVYGGDIAPGGELSERESYEQILLIGRLRRQVAVINSDIPEDAREQAIRQAVTLSGSPSGRENLLTNNETFHHFLIEKVRIPYPDL